MADIVADISSSEYAIDDLLSRLTWMLYLLVSQLNYTLANFADHCEQFSHDVLDRYLRREKIL